MKKYTYMIFVVVLSVVSSCIAPFDTGHDDTPVIYIESFPGASPYHVDMKILPAYSKSNSAQLPEFRPEILFCVNGKAVPVECVDSHEGRYRAYHSSQPGDCMTISVASEGFNGVCAETTIPELFPERKIDYRKVQSGVDSYDNVLYVTISDVNPEYSYGLQICNETVYDYPTGPERHVYNYSGSLYPMSDDLDEMEPISLEAVEIELSGQYMWAWEGRLIKEREASFAIVPQTYGYIDLQSYDSFFVQEGKTMMYDDYGNELGVVKYTSSNKLIMFTMSEEFYKYKVAYQFQADYDGFLSFVAPTNYCYSNIENGYGAFAGISIVETDWITKEFIENNR